MKIIYFLFFLLPITGISQWAGSTTINNNIYRNGNVGIGTSSPSSMLTINPLSTNNGSFFQMGKDIGSSKRLFNFGSHVADGSVDYYIYSQNGIERSALYAGSGLTYFSLSNNNGMEVFKVSSNNTSSFLQMPHLDSKVVIGDYSNYLANENHKLIVKGGSAKIEGNIITNASIGIGTNSFNDGFDIYRMSVNGKIRAYGIKVYNTWADYVFEDDYILPSLEEVEKHIKEKGHLKDIPSAAEVEEKGIDLGEMNKLLLQKIEELTLYIIEMNKEIEELKEQ